MQRNILKRSSLDVTCLCKQNVLLHSYEDSDVKENDVQFYIQEYNYIYTDRTEYSIQGSISKQ
jgi:hypothetical protein